MSCVDAMTEARPAQSTLARIHFPLLDSDFRQIPQYLHQTAANYVIDPVDLGFILTGQWISGCEFVNALFF
jgi:hypothetical protein